MVTGIEKFTQKDGLEVLKVWLAPTPQFPNGAFFYCEARDEDLVRSHLNWGIFKLKRPYVEAGASRASAVSTYRFHIEVARKYCNELPEAIDHYNGVEFDCVNRPNLFSVSAEQNSRNKRSKGYSITTSGSFYPQLIYHGRNIRSNPTRTEVQVLIDRSQLEKRYYSDYSYNFLEDRRTDMDLIMYEREGQWTKEQVIREYLTRHNNPWFFFRYDLREVYQQYGLPFPQEGKDYWIASDGFMVNKDGARLLPNDWLNKRA